MSKKGATWVRPAGVSKLTALINPHTTHNINEYNK